MKKVLLSVAAMVAISSYATAESYPAEGISSYKSIFGIDSDSAYDNRFYVGIGYSFIDASAEYTENREKLEFDFEGNAITLQAGYDFSRYLALEARYTKTVGDLSFDASYAGIDSGLDFDGDMSNFAVYIKPMYTTPQLSAYLLLGYGQFEMDIDGIEDDISENGLQWGLGINFHGGEHWGIFLDYVRFYDDSVNALLDNYSADLVIDSFSAGLNYKF